MITPDDSGKTSLAARLQWLQSPPGCLAVLLAAALLLSQAPPRLTDPLRSAWATLLRPAQSATTAALAFARDRRNRLQIGWADGARVAAAEQRATDLLERNRRLESELAALGAAPAERAADSGGAATQPLLRSQAIAARVLGQQAQAFLRGRGLLDFGSDGGATRGALVIDRGGGGAAKTLLDAGGDLGLEAGRIVLAGRRVWGKLARVGPHTSTVERITERGYRDLVQLAHTEDGRLRLGPRGMLVGGGEPLCRIELVAVTEPVSVGDEVFTAGDGVLTEPLIYGRVVRVERPAGASQWQIWMQPAIGADAPRQVSVLRMEINPARIAAADSSTAPRH